MVREFDDGHLIQATEWRSMQGAVAAASHQYSGSVQWYQVPSCIPVGKTSWNKVDIFL